MSLVSTAPFTGGDLNLRASIILLETGLVRRSRPTMIGYAFGRVPFEYVSRAQDPSSRQAPSISRRLVSIRFTPCGRSTLIRRWVHISSAVRLVEPGHPRVAEYRQIEWKSSENSSSSSADTVADARFRAQCRPRPAGGGFSEEGTLAETLKQLHDVYFPNVSIHSTRELYLTDPSFVTATVQASIFNPNRRMGK